ncbi:hypothetical protein DFH06DRAFT_1209605, partial [Mycena polygramma]
MDAPRGGVPRRASCQTRGGQNRSEGSAREVAQGALWHRCADARGAGGQVCGGVCGAGGYADGAAGAVSGSSCPCSCPRACVHDDACVLLHSRGGVDFHFHHCRPDFDFRLRAVPGTARTTVSTGTRPRTSSRTHRPVREIHDADAQPVACFALVRRTATAAANTDGRRGCGCVAFPDAGGAAAVAGNAAPTGASANAADAVPRIPAAACADGIHITIRLLPLFVVVRFVHPWPATGRLRTGAGA